MKMRIIYTLAIVALVNGEEGIYGGSNPETKLHNVNPYKRLLRIRSVGDRQVCVPGSTKMADCNRCFCVESGYGWACTRMECQVFRFYSPNPDDITTQSDVAHPSQRVKRGSVSDLTACEPGATKMEDCNSCFCIEDGSGWACTKMECLVHFLSPNSTVTESDVPNASQRAMRELQPVPFSCTPNSTFKDDCNWCTCSPDGRDAMCTLMECLPKDFQLQTSNRNSMV